jgi:hypothetical protein
LLKLLFTLLTDPLGLPIGPLWEYVILLIVGEIVHEIAWNISPGGVLGSPIYWVTKLLAFVLIWAALYAIIVAVQFVIAHWIWFTIGVAILIVASIAFIIWRRLHCQL